MITVEVITPENLQQTLEVEEVVIPTTAGGLGVRHGHLPLIAPLRPGEVIFKGVEVPAITVTSGIVSVEPSRVRLLLDSAPRISTSITEQISTATVHAEELRAQSHTSEPTPLLPQNLDLLKIARKKRRNREISPEPGQTLG
jgi:F-type H+-transporting ATPase subunit epsilon